MANTQVRVSDPVAELMDLTLQGDITAFDQIVEKYQQRIYNYVVRKVRDPCEAEDIAQEAFVKAFNNLGSFRRSSTFQTWLYRIASNLTLDSVRRRRRRENVCSLDCPIDTEEGTFAREQPDDGVVSTPATSLEVAEFQRTVHRAIQRLSPKLRSVIVLYELQGLNYEEIALILNCPLGTVKSRLFNARMALRAELQRTGLPGDLPISPSRPGFSVNSYIPT